MNPRYLTTTFAILMLILCVQFGCKSDESVSVEDQKIKDQTKIEQFLQDNNLTSIKTASGLHHIIIQEGIDSTFPNINSEVEVLYRGSLLNGQIFDQTSNNEPISFRLKEVILGWQEGLQLMKKGGKSMLIVPSHLGYGAQRLPGIPASSVLVFDVELVSFKSVKRLV